MEIRNLSEGNVGQLEELIGTMTVDNPEITYKTFRELEHSDELNPEEVRDLRKQVDELNETICDVKQMLKQIFDGHVLIDGQFKKFV